MISLVSNQPPLLFYFSELIAKFKVRVRGQLFLFVYVYFIYACNLSFFAK